MTHTYQEESRLQEVFVEWHEPVLVFFHAPQLRKVVPNAAHKAHPGAPRQQTPRFGPQVSAAAARSHPALVDGVVPVHMKPRDGRHAFPGKVS